MTDPKSLRRLFDVVIAARPEQRAEVAARICGDDEALQRRVLNMVAASRTRETRSPRRVRTTRQRGA